MRSTENLTATFHHGEHVSLTKFWQDKDVICPNTKVFYILSGEIVIETDEERILGKEGDMVSKRFSRYSFLSTCILKGKE